MSIKLDKIAAERDKAYKKRDEWEEKAKDLDRKYREQENAEICEMVHAQNLSMEDLAKMIRIAKEGAPDPANYEKLNDQEDENE